MSTTSRRQARHLAVAGARPGARGDRRPGPRRRQRRHRHLPGRLRLARRDPVRPGVRHAARADADVRRRTTRRPPHRSATGGPYGPDTCLNGYVWRARPSPAITSASSRRDASRRATTMRRPLRVATPCARGPPTTARPNSRAPATRARRARTTHSAFACAPTTSTSARRPCILHRTDTGREKAWHPQVGPNPSARPRPARLHQRDAALLGHPERVLRGARPDVRALVGPRQRPHGLLDALGKDPSARRRPCGRRAGGAPRCLVQAAAGRNGAAWARTRRQACGAVAWEEGASLSRLEGCDQDADRAPTRLCGSPVCRGCG